MPLDDKACYYTALRTHDARFDGRFFVGVSSTGIYCRPICRVKLPREENCSFFFSAAAAEAAGYRPCLKCRPELAPGLAPLDAPARIARKAVLIMEDDFSVDRRLSDLADMLGVTDRHLRRVFLNEYGVSPVQYLQTLKLLFAKNLLTDTRLSVTEVALAAGFGSTRRFNDLFKKRYRLTPSKFRKMGKEVPESNNGITLTLGYRPPYAWDELLSFLAERAIPGVTSDGQCLPSHSCGSKRGCGSPGLDFRCQHIGMLAFGWPDAFPHTDYGVKKALSGMNPREILDLSQAWRPWRSYATLNLWNSLAKG